MSSRAVQCVLLLAYTGGPGSADFNSPEVFTAVHNLGMVIQGKKQFQHNHDHVQSYLLSEKTAEIKLEQPSSACNGKSRRSNPAVANLGACPTGEEEAMNHSSARNHGNVDQEHNFFTQPLRVEGATSAPMSNKQDGASAKPLSSQSKMTSEQLVQAMESYSMEMEVNSTKANSSKAVPGSNVMLDSPMASSKVVIKQEVTDDVPTMYPCAFCEASFTVVDQLVAHEQSHSHLNSHVAVHHVHQCMLCDLCFEDVHALEAHRQNKHTGSKATTCFKCNKRLATKESLAMHMRVHTGEKPHKCEFCDRRFTQKAHMLGHLRGHTGEKPHQCRFCEKRFARRDGMLTHERLHTKELPFQCQYCDKRFPYRKSLQSHLRTHTGERPHSCSYCDKTFAEKHHLVSHERIHTREMPYSCQYCERTFSYKTTLVTHERTHTGEMPFSCDICSQRFTTKWFWKCHMKSDHAQSTPDLDVDIPPYQCNFCDEPFFEQSQLTAHEKTHTRVCLPCQHCKEIFTQKSDLVMHEKTHAGVS